LLKMVETLHQLSPDDEDASLNTSGAVTSSLLVISPAQVSSRNFDQATVQQTCKLPFSTPLDMRGVRGVNRRMPLARVNV